MTGTAAAVRVGAMAVLLGLLLAGAGCTDPDPGEPAGGGDRTGGTGGPASPLAGCDGLTEPLADPPADSPAGGGEPLPGLTLPCLTGGEPFRLAELRGPAVVNLWASWCRPCREELPVLQRYADQAAGRVHVLGVVTGDRRAAAVALAADLGIRFPALTDRDGELQTAIGVMTLPATLFVDAAGRVRHVHTAGALDRPELARLAGEHLGGRT